jgi:hypothetical protein
MQRTTMIALLLTAGPALAGEPTRTADLLAQGYEVRTSVVDQINRYSFLVLQKGRLAWYCFWPDVALADASDGECQPLHTAASQQAPLTAVLARR